MTKRDNTYRPRKRLGQHFLVDPNTIRRILAQLEAPEGAFVVEIGPGQGALTDLLVETYPDMVAIEVDPRSVAFLKERHPSLDVREMDILTVDWEVLREERPGPLIVVGNLPYNITSQILFGLLDSGCADRAVMTMQKEVAERIVAKPRTKEYGILSVVVQLLATPDIRFHLSPNVFFPKPEVWSSTVRIDWDKDPLDDDSVPPAFLRRLVRTAFNQRRKTLRNSLSKMVAEMGVELPDDIKPKRAEELTPTDFLDLAKTLLSASG